MRSQIIATLSATWSRIPGAEGAQRCASPRPLQAIWGARRGLSPARALCHDADLLRCSSPIRQSQVIATLSATWSRIAGAECAPRCAPPRSLQTIRGARWHLSATREWYNEAGEWTEVYRCNSPIRKSEVIVALSATWSRIVGAEGGRRCATPRPLQEIRGARWHLSLARAWYHRVR